jgi:protein O-mannosyl-transferase
VLPSVAPESEPSVSGGFWLPLLLALAGGAAYANSFAVPLVFDDAASIADNPTIRHLWPIWPVLAPPSGGLTVGGRPFLNLSFALNYAVSGTAVWSYHAVNLAIHVLAGLTLYGLVRRTLSLRAGRSASPIAFSVALLWILHPLQTESVTYIVQRAESLMGLLYLLTLYCFIRGVQSDGRARRHWFGRSIMACLCGMATKEVMVTAPLIVLLYDRTFLSGSLKEAWRRRWPVYIGLAATWLVCVFLVLSTHGRGGTAGYSSQISPQSYALTQFPAIVHYLRLCFWPHPLIFSYGSTLALGSVRVISSAVVIAVLLAASLWALIKQPQLGFLGISFFAILAPSSSLVPIATETMAEQRMYLPLIPVVILVVLGINRWLGARAMLLCLVLAAALFGATWSRNREYSNPLKLWADTVANSPDNFFAHYNYGSELDKIPGRSNDAIAQFQEALRLNPDLAEAHFYLGCVFQSDPGRQAEAIAEYEEAIRLAPQYYQAHTNLANALAVQGKIQDAIDHYETALRIRPDAAEIHFSLALVLSGIPGRTGEAVDQVKEGLRLRPDDIQARQLLSQITAPQP